MLSLGVRKRTRVDDEEDETRREEGPFEKRSRPATAPSRGHTHHDSVLNASTTLSSSTREHAKYDSDDDGSLVSEPGSPQDVCMSSGDEGADESVLSQSPEDYFPTHPRAAPRSILSQRLRTDRVPTPSVLMRPGASPSQIRTGIKQHVRGRHPQENHISSDQLEVPSPIDEDEVPTPPSAAEAAGSQLSMLSVSDVDMDQDDLAPNISIQPARSPARTHTNSLDSAVDMGAVDSGSEGILVRKQRQRSGALSGGGYSPVRVGPSNLATNTKRGFSMGFRADCEKCRQRVPGHMNHFVS